jgi:hypothetical protein
MMASALVMCVRAILKERQSQRSALPAGQRRSNLKSKTGFSTQ